MPTVTIDGKTIEVAPGTTILNAAGKVGVEIPTFCFHDGLTVAANCRICLVEVKGAPRLLAACEVQVQDGMEVLTDSPVVSEARKGVLEFILLNHPVDCPVCDCAGECELQDHYHEHSAQPSRINVKKVRKGKAIRVGPRVMLDKERCIDCSRCVRFLREVTGSGQLEQVQRGNKMEIAAFPGKKLDDAYSLCVVDLCPVGALTSRDFRFRKRVWLLQSAPSICPECARGCSVRADFEKGRIYRLVPRVNQEVNRWWMCDEGRLAFHRFEDSRVLYPYSRPVGGQDRRTTIDEAAEQAAEELSSLVAGGRKIAMVLSAFCSQEEALAAFFFAHQALNLDTVHVGCRADGEQDELLRVPDKNPNRAGIAALAEKLAVNLVDVAGIFAAPGGTELVGIMSVGAEYDLPRPPEGVRFECAVVLAVNQDEAAEKGTVVFPIPSHYEKRGTYVNCAGLAQQTTRAVPRPEKARSVHVILKKIARNMQQQLGYAGFEDLRDKALEMLSGADNPEEAAAGDAAATLE